MDAKKEQLIIPQYECLPVKRRKIPFCYPKKKLPSAKGQFNVFWSKAAYVLLIGTAAAGFSRENIGTITSL
jgi:hypothetical protein